ncbi:MAG: YfiR family protein [Dechloromonas sp.]|uniref:YfiR family protein n=1 Tax=Candidatus Dechloromonas phosphorivorans TaxID=2899244 RepID=A0A935JZ25_9RHOO|nr:YfiR family protein [Candidatus Dechloromonas phosphorivorans]
MHSRRRLLRSVLAAGSAALLGLPLAYGQQAPLSDQQLRAAFVLNFIRYTEWPERAFAAPDTPLMLCVLGNDPTGVALGGLAGKTVKGRTIQVRTVNTADEARNCHALFFADADARRHVSILRAVQTLPVLTISDSDSFIDIGGMIGLLYLDSRLQFEVNLAVVQHSQLKSSSQLLRLARNVIESKAR